VAGLQTGRHVSPFHGLEVGHAKPQLVINDARLPHVDLG
jgi:hypothetical protein